MIMRDIIINDILIPSLKRLYQEEYDNIRFGVSERNICVLLAHHMQNMMTHTLQCIFITIMPM